MLHVRLLRGSTQPPVLALVHALAQLTPELQHRVAVEGDLHITETWCVVQGRVLCCSRRLQRSACGVCAHADPSAGGAPAGAAHPPARRPARRPARCRRRCWSRTCCLEVGWIAPSCLNAPRTHRHAAVLQRHCKSELPQLARPSTAAGQQHNPQTLAAHTPRLACVVFVVPQALAPCCGCCPRRPGRTKREWLLSACC